jgi:hypothetical protein
MGLLDRVKPEPAGKTGVPVSQNKEPGTPVPVSGFDQKPENRTGLTPLENIYIVLYVTNDVSTRLNQCFYI